jgi:hypothetical protein
MASIVMASGPTGMVARSMRASVMHSRAGNSNQKQTSSMPRQSGSVTSPVRRTMLPIMTRAKIGRMLSKTATRSVTFVRA